MAKIELTEKQLRLVQEALELYARIGILQFDKILDHPSILKMRENKHRPKIKLDVGVKTDRGIITEIGNDYIKTKGSWGNGEEIKTWTDIENIEPSSDYSLVHEDYDNILDKLTDIKYIISNDNIIKSKHASYGIHRKNEGTHNMEAYDIVQVIRNEFYKKYSDKTNYTVDADVYIISDAPIVKVELD